MDALFAGLKSWKTATLGAIDLIVTWLGVARMMLDGDASTNPDWNLVMTATVIGIGLIISRDANKTSEDSIKPGV